MKLDIKDKKNIKILGTYYASGQSSPFRYIYFFNGFMLACSISNPPRIFRENSFEFLSNLNIKANFGRG
jgi:hypothetical protein